ncbi:MAG: hypothetical protein EBW79_06790, partial [Actinobacteria bacterium]|nr:hypothetical protein [Actinomycetota bacterium]
IGVLCLALGEGDLVSARVLTEGIDAHVEDCREIARLGIVPDREHALVEGNGVGGAGWEVGIGLVGHGNSVSHLNR